MKDTFGDEYNTKNLRRVVKFDNGKEKKHAYYNAYEIFVDPEGLWFLKDISKWGKRLNVVGEDWVFEFLLKNTDKKGVNEVLDKFFTN